MATVIMKLNTRARAIAAIALLTLLLAAFTLGYTPTQGRK